MTEATLLRGVGRHSWFTVLAIKRDGMPVMPFRTQSKTQAEDHMETRSRLEPSTYEHFICIETRTGMPPIISQWSID